MIRNLIYEIFVDRFAGPGGVELSLGPEADKEPWKYHAGGTLGGITAKLDHIGSLGADAIYLTPVFRAATNHKYDTETFDAVDPAFGGEEAFDRLAAAVRARGMGLILDGVFNHVGEAHPWFQAARADASSRHARFFKFTKHPDEYSRWRGHGFLPELDLDREEVLAELIDGEHSVLGRWLDRGATGWRLDCANDLGLSVCARATRAARSREAPDGVIGEVMTYAEDWVKNGRLDGVMNYWFRETVIGLCTKIVPPIQAAVNFERLAALWPKQALLQSWNVLSTHDTPRLATTVTDPRARALAMALAFTVPGVPLIYYGEELGMNGGRDPDNRRPMTWSALAENPPSLEAVRTLSRIRRERRALREGDYLAMPQPGAPSIFAFARTTEDPEEVVLVVANGGDGTVPARVFTPYSHLFDHLPLVDLLGRAPVATVLAGRIDVELEPWQVAIFAPDDTTIPGYRFFRRR